MFQSNQHQGPYRIFTVMHWKQCSAQSGRCSRRLEYTAQYEMSIADSLLYIRSGLHLNTVNAEQCI